MIIMSTASSKYQAASIKQRLTCLFTRDSRLVTRDFQVGDTIIEVLLAMAVIGIVLASAFGLANQAVRTGRDAHERGEALKLAESQLELLKSYAKSGSSNVATHGFLNFCVNMNSPAVGFEIVDASACTDLTPSGNSGGLYAVDITKNGASAISYTINITWDQINSKAADTGKVTLYYRTGVL